MTEPSAARTSLSLLGRLGQDATDQAAWGEFVRRYGPHLYRWCRRWKLQEADVEDVVQTVLVKLADKLRTFTYNPAQSFRAYLKTLTYYAWCDFLEKYKRPGAGSGDSVVLQALQSVEARDDLLQQLGAEFDQELLAEAQTRVRGRVEPHTWEAFRLTAVEGLAGAEVAARLGIKVATVFKAKSKVQKMLQEVIAELDPP